MNWKGDKEIYPKDMCYFPLVFFPAFLQKSLGKTKDVKGEARLLKWTVCDRKKIGSKYVCSSFILVVQCTLVLCQASVSTLCAIISQKMEDEWRSSKFCRRHNTVSAT